MIDLSTDMYRMFRFSGWFSEIRQGINGDDLVIRCYLDGVRYIHACFPLERNDMTEREVAEMIHQRITDHLSRKKMIKVETYENMETNEEEINRMFQDMEDVALRMTGTDNPFFRVLEKQGWEYKIRIMKIGYSRITMWTRINDNIQEKVSIRTEVYPYETKDLYERLRNRLISEKQEMLQKIDLTENPTEKEQMKESAQLLEQCETRLLNELESIINAGENA